MKTRLLLCLLLVISISLNAQSLNNVGLFPTIDHSGKLSDKWAYSLYYFGAVNMYNDEVLGKQDDANLFVLYAEQALHYEIAKGLTLTGSYVYERQRPFENTYRNEHRFYAQGTYAYKAGKVDVKHRLRFDGRFIQNRVTGKSPFTHRFRYLTGIKTSLSKNDKYYFSAYNEFFFDTHKGATTMYTEDWAAAAVGYKLNNNNSLEFGPLYIFWVVDNVNTRKNFYYLQLTWASQLDFRKKSNG